MDQQSDTPHFIYSIRETMDENVEQSAEPSSFEECMNYLSDPVPEFSSAVSQAKPLLEYSQFLTSHQSNVPTNEKTEFYPQHREQLNLDIFLQMTPDTDSMNEPQLKLNAPSVESVGGELKVMLKRQVLKFV